jgi:uncharacterized membrane protein
MNDRNDPSHSLADRYFRREWALLTSQEQNVLHSISARTTVSRDTGVGGDKRTFGERAADRIAAFGGSWTFILLFVGVLLGWIVTNTILLVRSGSTFDPYPFILLNLLLSMVAALQAPIIMMSQNRQAAKDRLDAAHDYEVNLKAELEIVRLHEKIDDIREQKWEELVALQQEQIVLLKALCKSSGIDPTIASDPGRAAGAVP